MSRRALTISVIAVVVVAAVLSPRLWRRAQDAGLGFPPEPSTAATSEHLVGRPLPSLADAEGWLNSGPLTADSLRGRPVLIVLWRDTDPASLRAVKRAQGWHEGYARFGLRVVGVHLPEFAFAADSSHAAAVVRRLNLSFPIALDPAFRLWSRFGAHDRTPRVVLADETGRVREDAAAGADLDRIERAVKVELKRENPKLAFPGGSQAPIPAAVSTPAPATPATVYLGSTRVARGPLSQAAPGRAQLFTAQFRFQVEGEPYTPYPVGLWKPSSEGLTAGRGGAENYVALRYDGGALGAVLSPPSNASARVWILRDERWLPSGTLGSDVRVDGRGASYVVVDSPRFYELCLAEAGEHVVKLSPEAPGVTVHAITFQPVADSRPRH
ncbi:MAG TPA: hypothetical protein VEY91_07255 [Candidatus Limnocylindria bacterium]|nr:hypothetical protein [Candidatus Limnocylindria bacterium]